MGDSRLEPLVLSEGERRMLENWVRRRGTAQGLALRAQRGTAIRSPAEAEEGLLAAIDSAGGRGAWGSGSCRP